MGRLLESSNKVIVLDNLITGDKKNIDQFMGNANFEFIEHDIQESIYFDEKLDHIIHLASCASPKAYSQYPINTLKSGSIGTINALGIAKKHNAKFFLASTSEVYGIPKSHLKMKTIGEMSIRLDLEVCMMSQKDLQNQQLKHM